MKLKQLLTIMIALVVVSGAAVAISGGVSVSGTITLDASDGPTVELVTTDESLLELDGPTDPNEVEIVHEDGEIVFESVGHSEARIDSGDIEGAQTQVTQINAENDLTISPGDKAPVTVSNGITSISWVGVASVDDGSTDLSYSASSSSTVVIETDAPGETIRAVNEEDSVVSGGEADSDGVVSLELPAGSNDIELQTANNPIVLSGDPDGEQITEETEPTLSAEIDAVDADETDESVDVTFFDGDGNELGTDTLSESGTATVTHNEVVGGLNEWYVEATLSGSGASATSDTFSFEFPAEVEIRDVVTGDLIMTEGDVEIEFLGDAGSIETREATDGTVDMRGLPIDEQFTASVDTDGDYIVRRAIIPSIFEQQTIYLLPDDGSVDTVEIRFELDDPTDQFGDNSQLILERPLENEDGETEFKSVAGDRFGISGLDIILERDATYRLRVVDPTTGATREVGEFTPTQSEAIRLEIDDVEFEVGEPEQIDGFEWSATFDDEDGQIVVDFSDDRGIASADLTVFERGNESNVIHDETYSGGTRTSIAADNGTNWVVQLDVMLNNGEEISVRKGVGSGEIPLGDEMPDRWQTIASMLTLIILGGLFGAVHPSIGGITVSATGGMFWFVGWLPGDTTGLMVLLALFISVLSYVSSRRALQ